MQKLLKKNLFGGLPLLWVSLFLAQILFAGLVSPPRANASNLVTDWGFTWNVDSKTFNWSADQITARFIDGYTLELAPTSKPENKVQAKWTVSFGSVRSFFIAGNEPCTNAIFVSDDVTTSAKVEIQLQLRPNSLDNCYKGSPDRITVTVQNPELATAFFHWVDSGRIEQIPDDGSSYDYGMFTVSPDDPNIFTRNSESDDAGCQDRILVSADKTRMKLFELDDSADGFEGDDAEAEIKTGCNYRTDGDGQFPNNADLALTDVVENSGKPAGEGDSVGIPISTPGGDTEASCETSGFDFSWIFCKMIDGLASLTQGIFTNIIEPYLETSPVDTSPTINGQPNPIYQVWSAMRNIANIILIFALLFIVFGQSIGGGLVDAYTAKKAMPRILVAAILINLSLFVVSALVDLFNVIGRGIGDLIIGPFRDTTLAKFETSSGTGSVGVVVSAIVGVLILAILGAFATGNTGNAASAYLVPFLHFLLVSVLLPAALVSLAIFATLIIRRSLILVLIVLAPIAFALFAVPNTDKYFKKWWSTLATTLMVYPIITVLFSVSAIMAAISYNAGDAVDAPLSGTISAVVALIVMIVPLVLIPFAFKLAGGVMTGIATGFKSQTDKFSNSRRARYNEMRGLERKTRFERANPLENPTGRWSKMIAARETLRGRGGAASRKAGGSASTPVAPAGIPGATPAGGPTGPTPGGGAGGPTGPTPGGGAGGPTGPTPPPGGGPTGPTPLALGGGSTKPAAGPAGPTAAHHNLYNDMVRKWYGGDPVRGGAVSPDAIRVFDTSVKAARARRGAAPTTAADEGAIIKDAYRTAATSIHPDKSTGDKELFQGLSALYSKHAKEGKLKYTEPASPDDPSITIV